MKTKYFKYNKQNKTFPSGQYCIYEALNQVILPWTYGPSDNITCPWTS